MDNPQGLTTLKELLFEEEREKYEQLSSELKDVNHRIEESLTNREVPDEEIDQIVNKMVTIMPEKLGPTITQTLKVQIKESKDEVVQALFPIIGQMIKKYVAQEIAVLSEKIDRQMESLFSWDMLILRMKAMVQGVSFNELVVQQATEAQIQQIFIIEEGSGLLMASYARTQVLDQDMTAGMLTAIKAFVEDSIQENEQLETVAYQTYSIYVQSFNKFYVAVALSGNMTAAFKSQLDERILKFVKDHSSKDTTSEKMMVKQIERHFKSL